MTTQDASGTITITTQLAGATLQIPGNDRIGPLLAATLACADAALDPQVGRASLYPGAEIAYDDCCDGQVWVRLISLTPAGNPTATRTTANPCGVLMWAATIGIGALRCAATLDDQGNAPTPAQLTADTHQMTADAAALSQAIQCCLTPQVNRATILRWDPLGPSGGCVGGEWTVTVLTDNCPCP